MRSGHSQTGEAHLTAVTDQVVQQFEQEGFAILRGVIDRALIEEARAHVEWLMRRYPHLRPEHLHHPLIRNDAFWVRMVTDDRILDVAERFLGPDLACFTAHYICKPPHDGHPVFWHQDGAYWQLDPMQALTVWLAIDDSAPDNGCLKMIPGSHRMPLRKPSVRTDTPNMLYSTADEQLVREWVDRAGVVDVVLEPGDLSIHHPNALHCSEPNTSSRRRCGLDMGFISTSTRISNDGLYLDPLLVRGTPRPGINRYRPHPRCVSGETIPFRGQERWNARVGAINQLHGFTDDPSHIEAPIQIAERMIRRLQEGTVKQ